MKLTKLYINDQAKHAVLPKVMGHAANKLYINKKYVHTYINTYIHTINEKIKSNAYEKSKANITRRTGNISEQHTSTSSTQFQITGQNIQQ